MPKIFVNTDNSSPTSKVYLAAKVGSSAGAVEKKMQDTVRGLLKNSLDFTTDKQASSKGYSLRIEVTKVVPSGADTVYTIHNEIVRYPSSGGKSGKGAEMVSLQTKDITITVTGHSEGLLLDGVEAATENIVAKALPQMKIDMTKR